MKSTLPREVQGHKVQGREYSRMSNRETGILIFSLGSDPVFPIKTRRAIWRFIPGQQSTTPKLFNGILQGFVVTCLRLRMNLVFYLEHNYAFPLKDLLLL